MGCKPKLLDPPAPREDTLGFFFPNHYKCKRNKNGKATFEDEERNAPIERRSIPRRR